MTSNIAATRMADWLERAWLARYLDRELDAEEVAWFEAYALDKVELLDAIETDTRLRDGYVFLQTMQESRAELSAQGPESRENTGGGLVRSRRPSVSWIGIAASLLVALGVGWFGGRSIETRVPAIVANPTIYTYGVERGGDGMTLTIENEESDSPNSVYRVPVPQGAEDIMLHADGEDVVRLVASGRYVAFSSARQHKPYRLTFRIEGHEHEISLDDPRQKQR